MDTYGYGHQVDERRGGRVYWKCSTRSTLRCGATVTQTDDQYIRGRHVHVDTPIHQFPEYTKQLQHEY